jgi:hypothetical protein
VIRRHILSWAVALLPFSVSVYAQKPVYVVLWFDTEDYIEPAADDAALRIATDLSDLGVRATFKLVGEKARVLESRGRTDVLRALARHSIGYHSNYHSLQPVPAVYLRTMGFLEGAGEFERREEPGVADIRRIFGVNPICYGQPGSSWAPQSNRALRHMGIPVYLDEGSQVGVDEQPVWYGGLLYIFNLGQYLMRPDLDSEDNRAIFRRFDEAAKRLAAGDGGVISTYFHPTEFVTTEFWDAVNFSNGAVRERSEWVRPRRRTPEASERCYRILRGYVEHAKRTPGVQFVTAQDLLQLYSPMTSRAPDREVIARHLATSITFLRSETGTYSAADLLLALLGLEPMAIDGPVKRGSTTYDAETIPAASFERVKEDVRGFIKINERLPGEVFIGAQTLSLEDFAATLAGSVLQPGPVRVRRGKLGFERYVTTEASAAFKWPIHPQGFAAPELLELARLQAWTLKPACLR